MPVILSRPCGFRGRGELSEIFAQLFDTCEVLDPEQLLFQRPDGPLFHAVAFRLAHEGRRAFDAEELDLVLEVLGHVIRAVVIAKDKTYRILAKRRLNCRSLPRNTVSTAVFMLL